jgi:hypothetical protein
VKAERRGCSCIGALFVAVVVALAVAGLAFWATNYELATGQRDPVETPAPSERFAPVGADARGFSRP